MRLDLYEGDSTRFARAIDSIYSGKFEAQHKRFNKANESGLFFSLDDTNAQGGLNQPDKVNQSMGQAIRSVFKLGKMKEDGHEQL